MKYYVFYDYNTSEGFIVETDTKEKHICVLINILKTLNFLAKFHILKLKY